MSPQEFCRWLQGFLDAAQPEGMTVAHLTTMKAKLEEALAPRKPETVHRGSLQQQMAQFPRTDLLGDGKS